MAIDVLFESEESARVTMGELQDRLYRLVTAREKSAATDCVIAFRCLKDALHDGLPFPRHLQMSRGAAHQIDCAWADAQSQEKP